MMKQKESLSKSGVHKKVKEKRSARKKNLTAKLGFYICVILVVVFTVFIVTTVLLTKTQISAEAFGKMQQISQKNAIKIEQIVSRAENLSQEIGQYADKAFSDTSAAVGNAEYSSKLYGSVKFGMQEYQIENYLISTIETSVANNESILDAGVYFEPNIMSQDLESYALHVGSEGTVEPSGDYETYSKEIAYTQAIESDHMIITSPYDNADGIKCVTAATPIHSGDKLMGVVEVVISLKEFDKVDSLDEKYPSMYTAILMADGTIIYESSGLDYVGTNTFEYMSDEKAKTETKNGMDSNKAFYTLNVNSTNDWVYKFYDVIPAGDSSWFSMTAVNRSEVNRAATNTGFLLFALCLAALVIIVIIITRILKSMISPIQQVMAAADSISEGNLNVSIDVTSEDEIGNLAQVFRKTAGSLQGMIGDINQILGEMADGNFNLEFQNEAIYVGDFENIIISVKKLNSKLNETLIHINETSDQVALGSTQMAQSAQSLAEGAMDQAGAVEELQATINSVSDQAKDNAKNSMEAYDRAKTVETEAEVSSKEMSSLTIAMEDISTASTQIANIIADIEDIASQTNLLSLNAAIEAARAGEAGKGFAVVADQIRKLADDSGKSAVRTRELIESALKSVENGHTIANNTAESLEKVIAGLREIGDVVQATKEASEGQAEVISQVEQGIEQISSVVQCNSAGAEETSATSEELSAQAVTLSGLVGQFQLNR